MYAKYSHLADSKTGKLRRHHHVRLDREFKFDCEIWTIFLSDPTNSICRPMVDIRDKKSSTQIDFFTDSSGNEFLGFGGVYQNEWFFGQWEPGFIKTHSPSIAFLELFALTAGILIWSKKLSNSRITVFCDNQATVQMVNDTSSNCPNCMYLI